MPRLGTASLPFGFFGRSMLAPPDEDDQLIVLLAGQILLDFDHQSGQAQTCNECAHCQTPVEESSVMSGTVRLAHIFGAVLLDLGSQPDRAGLQRASDGPRTHQKHENRGDAVKQRRVFFPEEKPGDRRHAHGGRGQHEQV